MSVAIKRFHAQLFAYAIESIYACGTRYAQTVLGANAFYRILHYGRGSIKFINNFVDALIYTPGY